MEQGSAMPFAPAISPTGRRCVRLARHAGVDASRSTLALRMDDRRQRLLVAKTPRCAFFFGGKSRTGRRSSLGGAIEKRPA